MLFLPDEVYRPTDSVAGAAVSLVGVGKTYHDAGAGPVVALDDVSIDLADGAFLAILGPSGCGKSTLIRMVAALETPSRGSVTVAGREPAALVRDHRIGMSMQEHALLPWLSVRDNVALPARVAGRAVDWSAVDALVELVGLTEFAASRPRHLSGGMRQRVSIARSLLLDPTVLLLDEPFGALDAVTRRHLNFELQDIWLQRRVSTILVTHSVEEAVFLADRVLVLSPRPGRLRLVRDIPFPRPRAAGVRRAPEFRALVDELTECLDNDSDTGPC